MQRSPAAPTLPGFVFSALLAAAALLIPGGPAACAGETARATASADTTAADPSAARGDPAVVGVITPQPVVPPPPPAVSYTRAYVALGAGAALTLGSFLLANEADQAYQRYLDETDPALLEGHYDDAQRYDQLATATLIAGQAALLLGVYWRFVHPARKPGDVSLRPILGPDHAGLALTLALP